MAGICKYCGFCGTHEALADHAGHCPPEQSPPDTVVETLHIAQQANTAICPCCTGDGIGADESGWVPCRSCGGTGKQQ
jgi:hypothetical protein